MVVLDLWAIGLRLSTEQLEDWCSFFTRLPVEEVRSRGPHSVALDWLKQHNWLSFSDFIVLKSTDKNGKPLYVLLTDFKITKRSAGDPKLRPTPVASKDSVIVKKLLPLEKLQRRNNKIWRTGVSYGVCEWPYEGIYSSAALFYLYKHIKEYYPDDRDKRAIARQKLNYLLDIEPFHDKETNIITNMAVRFG